MMLYNWLYIGEMEQTSLKLKVYEIASAIFCFCPSWTRLLTSLG